MVISGAGILCVYGEGGRYESGALQCHMCYVIVGWARGGARTLHGYRCLSDLDRSRTLCGAVFAMAVAADTVALVWCLAPLTTDVGQARTAGPL